VTKWQNQECVQTGFTTMTLPENLLSHRVAIH